MKKQIQILLVASLLPLSSCANNMGTKQTIGTLGGAVAGGVIGAQFGGGTGALLATGAGVLLGGLLGSEIGASMDEADAREAAAANKQAYNSPIGEPIRWKNPQSGHHGTVTPVRDGYAQNGNYCREFQQTITVGGKTQNAYGTACRQPDGSWKIIQ